MPRHLTPLPLTLLLVLFAGCATSSPTATLPQAKPFELAPGATPHTSLRFNANPANFQFALIGDRTGGDRPGVFEATIKRLNRLQPEFAISVGDLIEGYSDDRKEIEGMWAEIDRTTSQLNMPFLSIPGNHDLGNEVMHKVWKERMGRDYYYFLYKNVLFLMLDTEDPPVALPKETLQQIEYFKKLLKEDPAKAQELVKNNRSERKKIHLPVAIGDEQVEYVRKVLDAHRDVRWTFFILHKPAWQYDAPNFRRIEALAKDRPYTMFAGHEHNYERTVRNGHGYIRLGTSGGTWLHEGIGNMDHITWVTMGDDGPIITNLLLNGILDESGATENSGKREFTGE